MPEPRDLMSGYREALRVLRRNAGPAGVLFAPLELTADVLEQLVTRQQELEAQLGAAMQPLGALAGLARDAPAALRTQAKAFEAAALSFGQAAEVLNLQADLLERTIGVLDAPAGLLRSLRATGGEAAPEA